MAVGKISIIQTNTDAINRNGVTNHNALYNRALEDQHPIFAITGLEDKLKQQDQTSEQLSAKIDAAKKYYYANAEWTKDLFFYVLDNLVESYRSTTNWFTYADQIRPISELYGLSIDTTTINEHQYENDQTIPTALGLSVTEIDDYAFYNATLTSAIFSQCTSIGDYTFAKSTSLKDLLLHSNLVKVGKYAFSDPALSTINYPAITDVPEGMLKDCTSLKTCALTAVTNIGKWALQNTALTSISYDKLIRIEEGAFKDCAALVTVTLPKVVAIEKEAFMNDALDSLSLPLVTSIKDRAFANNKLTEVSIPNITILGDRAFANNSDLTSINLYAISSMGEDVFDGCAKLTDITFTGYSVPVCACLPENCTLHVRTILVDDFKVAFPNNTVVGDVE